MHRFEQLWRRGDRAKFEIECSSGTYVRSLVADLTARLSPAPVARVPFLAHDVHDLDTLAEIGGYLF